MYICPRCNHEAHKKYNLAMHFQSKNGCKNENNVELTPDVKARALDRRNAQQNASGRSYNNIGDTSCHSQSHNTTTNNTTNSHNVTNQTTTNSHNTIDNTTHNTNISVVKHDKSNQVYVHNNLIIEKLCLETPIQDIHNALVKHFDLKLSHNVIDFAIQRRVQLKNFEKALNGIQMGEKYPSMPDIKKLIDILESIIMVPSDALQSSCRAIIKNVSCFINDAESHVFFVKNGDLDMMRIPEWTQMMKNRLPAYLMALQQFCMCWNAKTAGGKAPELHGRSKHELARLFRLYPYVGVELFYTDRTNEEILEDAFDDQFTRYDVCNDVQSVCREIYSDVMREHSCEGINIDTRIEYSQVETLKRNSACLKHTFKRTLTGDSEFLLTMTNFLNRPKTDDDCITDFPTVFLDMKYVNEENNY